MKVYDLIFNLLSSFKTLRDSDKRLIWKTWEKQGLARDGVLTKEDFLCAKSVETITRTRRSIQAKHPSLRANRNVRRARGQKEMEKGTYIYRERL